MDHRQDKLEKQFSLLAQALDNALEDKFGAQFKLHPNRQKRGAGANPSFDGLFATTVAFTLGYGSEFGRGYIVNIDVRTLESVPLKTKEEINSFAKDFLSKNLKVFIPDREIKLVKDGKLLKLVGDFSLG